MGDPVWQPEALAALRSIIARGNRFSSGAGTRLGQRLRNAAEAAAARPRAGRMVPEFQIPAFRERTVGPYRLITWFPGGTVEIISIVHGARDLSGDEARP